MKKSRALLLGSLVLGIVSGVSLARAQAPAEKPQTIYDDLHVTQEQKTKLQQNRALLQAKMKSFREQNRSLRQSLRQELMKPQLDMNKIKELIGSAKNLEAQMVDERLNSLLTLRTILTPQQFSDFLNLAHKPRHAKAERPVSHEEKE